MTQRNYRSECTDPHSHSCETHNIKKGRLKTLLSQNPKAQISQTDQKQDQSRILCLVMRGQGGLM